MDKEIVKLIISPVAILLGVVMGFLLNFLRDSYEHKLTRKEERNSVRTLIKLEIQQNIDELRIFWNQSNEMDDSILDPKEKISIKVRNLSKTPIPFWSYLAWESQMSKIPIVFKSEEIVQLQSVYKKFRQTSNILNLLPDRKINIGMTIATTYKVGEIVPINNYVNESSFWNDFENLVLDILHVGNPLGKK